MRINKTSIPTKLLLPANALITFSMVGALLALAFAVYASIQERNFQLWGPISVSTLAVILTYCLWRAVTFSRADLKRLVRPRNFKLERTPFLKTKYYECIGYYPFVAFSGKYYLAGEIESMLITYSNGTHRFHGKKSLSRHFTPGGIRVPYAYSTSIISFFFLADLPEVGRYEIYLQDETREFPETSLAPLDEILQEMYKGDKDAHLIIELNRNYLKIMVVGGTMLGKRYEKRILKALDMADRLAEILNEHYPSSGQWSEYEVRSEKHLESYHMVRTFER